ncbi:MAG: cytochrome P450 [Verrucomicrobiales bacterium]|nr:cytochrome P450 [Verrucomicrobiales bacterium]
MIFLKDSIVICQVSVRTSGMKERMGNAGLDKKAAYSGQMQEAAPYSRTGKLGVNPALFFEDLFLRHGDFVHYRGLMEFYAINHPALIKQVLNETHRHFDKQTPIYDRFRNALGNSLVNAEGRHWKRQRKLLQPVFRSDSIRDFFRTMADACETHTERWDQCASDGKTLWLADEFAEVTLRMAGQCLFSSAFDSAADDIRRWTRTINTYSSIPPLRVLNNPRVPTYFNLKLRRVLKEYREFLRALIEERLTDPSRNENDLLTVFLSMKDEETNEPMSLIEVSDEVLGMIIGGHESGSTALTWTIFQLQRHPEIEAEVVAEIDRVSGGKPLRLEQIPELVLTERVIQEAMRLHPPLWFENRNALEDAEIQGIRVPRGSVIAISRYSLHRNPEFWEAPGEFIPGRFDPEDTEHYVDSKSAGTYLPFSRGPRVCIGRHFAMMQMVLVVATLLSRYRVRAEPPLDDAFTAHLTINLKSRLPVRLERRT